ncbi:unnamed protein product [Phytomonas sp. EM1]|nr:unnamed protein product [Phytomonas sp. EM1]|eukprot:CCW63672.1 unnamed protein product [Phytomonas sp. isolate EM1]
MSSRVPLPLRVVNGSWRVSDPRPAATPIWAVFKPPGLPLFPRAQVLAAKGDGRRLLTLPHAIAHPPEGGSDDLLARAAAMTPPGGGVFLALPLPSPLRLRGGVAAAAVEGWGARAKGLTLLAREKGGAAWLRNAARMGLLEGTHRVLCRLPRGIAERARRGARAKAHASDPHPNPFIREHLLASSSSSSASAFSPSAAAASMSFSGLEMGVGRRGGRDSPDAVGISIVGADGALPTGLPHDPLIKGGFIHFGLGVLRYTGTLSATLCNRSDLRGKTERILRQKRRLNGLFLPVELGDPRRDRGEDASGYPASPHGHAWIPAEHLLSVSFGGSGDSLSDKPTRRRRNATADDEAPFLTREVRMEYKLLALSPHPNSDWALYEVRGHDLTSEEIQTLFAAEGFFVLNDFENDPALAALMERVAGEIRRTLPAALADVPMNIQHLVRNGNAEELVALPLIKRPLECADHQALRELLERRRELLQSGVVFEDDPPRRADPHAALKGGTEGPEDNIDEDAEFFSRIEKMLQAYSAKGVSKHTPNAPDIIGKLLFDALGRLSGAEQERIVNICLGTGVECIGVTYPDPTDIPTIHSMQQLYQRFEQTGKGEGFDPTQTQHAEGMKFISHCSLGAVDSTGSVQVEVGWLLSLPSTNLPKGGGKLAQGMPGALSVEVSVSFAAALLSPHASAAEETEETKEEGTGVVNAGEKTFAESHEPSSSALPPPRFPLSSAPQLETNTGCEMDTTAVHPLHHTLTPIAYQEWFRGWFEAQITLEKGGEGFGKGEMPTPLRVFKRKDDTPLFIRAEELGDFVCVVCGRTGHPWQCCPQRHEHPILALPPLPSLPTEAEKKSPTGESLSSLKGLPVMTSEPLGSLEDLDGALAATETATSQALLRPSTPFTGGEVGSLLGREMGFFSSSEPIAVPNQAPTLPFHPSALHHERRKPPPHRRVLRCAYCHGRHPLTECPRLSGVAELSGEAFNPARAREQPEKLFCIRCGRMGHLFTSCPEIPEGLHPGTHCPICEVATRKIRHTAMQCPRRMTLPAGYLPNGVPQEFVNSTQRAEKLRSSSSTSTMPRRGRSMLISDSFVNSKLKG